MTQATQKSMDFDKALYVNNMFAEISGKYDLLNNLMTFGCHNKWKEETINLALKEVKEPKMALDLCSGTGDLALILNSRLPEIKIKCIDNCSEMLEIAKAKFKNLNIQNIETTLMDSENLSFQSDTFDLVTVGFGLRNLVNKEKCLKGVYGILNPGGVFSCIDLGFPVNSFWQKIFFLYFYNLVPKLGEMFAKNKEAYTYLPMSLKTWYKQEELKDLIIKTGFKKCYFKNIFGGVVAIHIAVK